jgi:alpha-beta hydrolase superfamily lysophospholipase
MKPAALRGTPRFRAAVALVFIAASLGGCAALEMKERELLFRPTREAAGWYSGMPDGVREIYLPVGASDGTERIHAWWWPADDPAAPVVYYLHGVRWNLTGQLNRISQLRRFGFSVFAIDYRGFGKSDGELPSEASVYEDARAGWQWVVGREPDASRRYIYGHSLGGAVAIDLAAKLAGDAQGARGLIVEASFTSLSDLVSEMGYGWLPARMLLTQKFDSVEKIGQIRMPVLIVHGADDRYVPARLSEALYEAAPPPKKLLLIPNGSHNNSVWTGDVVYRQALQDLFQPVAMALPPGAGEVAVAGPGAGTIPVNRARGLGVLESVAAQR